MSHPGLPWRFGAYFPNGHNERHAPEGLGWPQSSESNDPPQVSWSVKHYPVNEYSMLSMMVHCDSADAIQMSVVECVISHSHQPHFRLLLHPFENQVVFKFILLKGRSEEQHLKLYGDTSFMIHNSSIIILQPTVSVMFSIWSHKLWYSPLINPI